VVAVRRRSVSITIILSTISVALSVAMVVGWVLVIVNNMKLATEAVATSAWLMVGGILSFVVITTVLVLFTVFLVREILEVRRQTSFIDSVTHELKSPLASLKLCAETLARPELEAERREQLRVMMLDDVNRLITVIDGILHASRVGQGKVAKVDAEVDLSELVTRAVEDMLRRHRLEAPAVHVDVPEGTRMYTDSNALRTVIENLVDNAIKYSGGAPAVVVRGREIDDGFQIEVEDAGIGIGARDLERVFDRFYRVPVESVRTRHGTGLGLFVVSSLVKDLGGKITAHSEGEGSGTTMRVRLPRRSRGA
jgi:signal transduction histidine kinase